MAPLTVAALQKRRIHLAELVRSAPPADLPELFEQMRLLTRDLYAARVRERQQAKLEISAGDTSDALALAPEVAEAARAVRDRWAGWRESRRRAGTPPWEVPVIPSPCDVLGTA